MRAMRGRARTSGPWLLAGMLLAANLVSCALRLAVDYHGFFDVLCSLAAFVPICRHYAGQRPGPGQMIVSIDDFRRAERTVRESIAAGHGEACILQSRRNEREARASAASAPGRVTG